MLNSTHLAGELILTCVSSAAAGTSGDRSRLSFSCRGSTVDLQGGGECVYTTGHGTAYAANGTIWAPPGSPAAT